MVTMVTMHNTLGVIDSTPTQVKHSGDLNDRCLNIRLSLLQYSNGKSHEIVQII